MKYRRVGYDELTLFFCKKIPLVSKQILEVFGDELIVRRKVITLYKKGTIIILLNKQTEENYSEQMLNMSHRLP